MISWKNFWSGDRIVLFKQQPMYSKEKKTCTLYFQSQPPTLRLRFHFVFKCSILDVWCRYCSFSNTFTPLYFKNANVNPLIKKPFLKPSVIRVTARSNWLYCLAVILGGGAYVECQHDKEVLRSTCEDGSENAAESVQQGS